MADLTYKFSGVNTAKLADEVEFLRRNSGTFRALEAAAVAAGYKVVDLRMGAGLLNYTIADSQRADPTTWRIRIDSDASGSWGPGRRQATVGEVIAHELAHAVVPPEFQTPGVIDFQERGREGMWVRRQAGQVALELGLPGPNNADVPLTRIPIDKDQACTAGNPQGNHPEDGVLFLNGLRGYNGKDTTIPTDPNVGDSRRLAMDGTGPRAASMPAPGSLDASANSPEASTSPDNYRRLTRRPAGRPSVFDTGAPAVPFVPSAPAVAPNAPNVFDGRFGNWSTSPASAPVGPAGPVAPPTSGPDAPDDDWLARLFKLAR